MIITIIDLPRKVSREANLRALTNARIEIIRYGKSNRLSIEYKEDYTRYIIQDRKDTGLKHCPFCGSDDVFYEQIYDRNSPIEDAFRISCGSCQIDFSCGDSTKEELAELWNRRVIYPMNNIISRKEMRDVFFRCNPGVVCTHEGPCNKTCGGDHYYNENEECLRCGQNRRYQK